MSSWFIFLAGAGGEGMEPGAATLKDRENALQQQAGLGEEEKQLVIELLNWDVKIETARLEQERLRREIPLQEETLAALEIQLEQSRAALEEGRARLGRWINHLYRCGALTYLDVVLGAADFDDFIERAEMVGIILASQAKMLDEVRGFTIAVRENAEAVRQTHEELTIKSRELDGRLQEMEAARAGREEFLGDLRVRSADLASRVAQAETQWYNSLNSLHYLLANLHTLPLYNLSPVSSEITFSGLRLVYSDEEINKNILKIGDANLAGFSVRCYPGRFTVTGPAALPGGPDFIVEGHFQMLDGGKIRYQPVALTLAGVPVSREVLGYVSSESGMVIDAGAYLESFRLSGVSIEEGRLVINLAFK
ncbi:coiled-coil domain-containing protein [Pelotomaculum propionicicum]|uniref:coiled-coil domain-containing protein n=1 Tax=Pelotomaculum propionicicum TaxID=258475 RepID=UPI003BA2F3A3